MERLALDINKSVSVGDDLVVTAKKTGKTHKFVITDIRITFSMYMEPMPIIEVEHIVDGQHMGKISNWHLDQMYRNLYNLQTSQD